MCVVQQVVGLRAGSMHYIYRTEVCPSTMKHFLFKYNKNPSQLEVGPRKAFLSLQLEQEKERD